MPGNFDLKVFVEHPPEITIDGDDLVHVIDRNGDMALERIMSPNTLRAYALHAQEVLAKRHVANMQ